MAPRSAWACRPNFHHIEEPTIFEGPDGKVFWKYATYEVTGISPATDLGDGYVVQHMIDGNQCYAEISSVVQNCATGEAVDFGGNLEAMIPGPRQEDILEELNVLLEERAYRAWKPREPSAFPLPSVRARSQRRHERGLCHHQTGPAHDE